MFEGEEMNYREEITKLIRASYDQGAKDAQQEALAALEQMVAAARADEREACARIAEEPSATTYECTVACGGPAQTFQQRFPKHSHDIAKEIRARGNT
jgi:hypothetical protein